MLVGAGLALETINPENGSRLYRAVLTDVRVGGSIIDGPVAVPVVGRLGVSIPGIAVSRIPVWSRATRQARQQSKNYRQVFEHRVYLPTKVTGRIGLRTPLPRASPCEYNDVRLWFQPVWPHRPRRRRTEGEHFPAFRAFSGSEESGGRPRFSAPTAVALAVVPVLGASATALALTAQCSDGCSATVPIFADWPAGCCRIPASCSLTGRSWVAGGCLFTQVVRRPNPRQIIDRGLLL